MSNAEDVQQVELSIEQAKKLIARKDALVRLQMNPDFKLLIEDGFLSDHAVRQVMLKAHPGYMDEKHQKIFDTQIMAVGGLKQFLVSIFAEGMNAEQAIRSDERTLEELHAEGLNEANLDDELSN